MIWLYAGFIACVLLMLVLDLGGFHRKAHVVSVKEALAGMVDKFRYLKVSLALVLMVVGIKMLIAEWLKAALGKHFNFYLLTLVFVILAAGIVASLLAERAGASRKSH